MLASECISVRLVTSAPGTTICKLLRMMRATVMSLLREAWPLESTFNFQHVCTMQDNEVAGLSDKKLWHPKPYSAIWVLYSFSEVMYVHPCR